MTNLEEAPEVAWLVWDEWNTEHIAKHGIIREDVEQLIAGDTVARLTRKGRFLVLGLNQLGRLLAAVIGPVPDQPGAYYTFSARPASRQERRYYHEQNGGEKLRPTNETTHNHQPQAVFLTFKAGRKRLRSGTRMTSPSFSTRPDRLGCA